MRACNLGVGVVVIERILKMSGREFLAKIVRDMKCKSVGKMAETFVGVAEEFRLGPGQIDGNFIYEGIAASIKIAEYMTAS